MHEIALTVARYFDVWHEALRQKRRTRKVIIARHVAMYIIREKTGRPYAEIGEYFHRDHATVLHAINAVKNDMATNLSYREDVMYLLWNIKSTYTPATYQKFCNPVKFEFYVSK